jgi:predicted dehydrogenase
MIKVGMIGCGGMGNAHGPVLARLPNVKVVGTCDLIPEKAKALADKIGVTRHCTDFRDLLPDVDAVWVCTEPFNRLDIVTTAAKAGKHIFTEKPISNTLAEADIMIAAARKAKVKYMLGYCLRFWPMPFGVLHDTLAGGELGDLVSCWSRRIMPWNPSHLWYGHQEKSGGVMLDFGSHDVDWLRWLGGDVKTVYGRTFKVRESMNADEHGTALFEFKSGAVATIENSWFSHMLEMTAGIVGTKGSMFYGSDGKVRRRLGDGQEQVVEGESVNAVDPNGTVGKKDEDGKILKVKAESEMIQEHFFRCIEQDIEPLTSAEEGRKTLLTVMALWESSKTGKAVKVDSMARASRRRA